LIVERCGLRAPQRKESGEEHIGQLLDRLIAKLPCCDCLDQDRCQRLINGRHIGAQDAFPALLSLQPRRISEDLVEVEIDGREEGKRISGQTGAGRSIGQGCPSHGNVDPPEGLLSPGYIEALFVAKVMIESGCLDASFLKYLGDSDISV